MKRILAVLIALVVFLPNSGCTPKLSAETRLATDLVLATATGDTLRTSHLLRVLSGTLPDSIKSVFTAPNTPTRVAVVYGPFTLNTQIRVGPVDLIPSPALAGGASLLITACATAYKAGVAYPAPSCATKVYVRPILPPVLGNDSLEVAYLDIWPKGQMLTASATSACMALYSSTQVGSVSGWKSAWDATTQDWKSACKADSTQTRVPVGTPMVVAYCAAIVMKDSTRVLNALWTSLPWCSKYTSQVPKRTASVRQQRIADRAVTWLAIRTQGNQGSPQTGWQFEEPYHLTMVRDPVNPLPPLYVVSFITADSTPGGGANAYPGMTLHVKQQVRDNLGRPVAGVAITNTPLAGSGTIAMTDYGDPSLFGALWRQVKRVWTSL